VSPEERAAIDALTEWGMVDTYREAHPEAGRYSWWDYRAGHFHKNFGMRIDLLLASHPVADRMVWAEIDREARKGKPIPSDHAPVLVDLDEKGAEIDAKWERADKKKK
jgi:exodeoxyribonuclease-3